MYFLKERRASLLIGGGSVTLFVWFLFMIGYKLFDIRPFGAETRWSMGVTLLLFLPLSFVLLWLVYYFGSDQSPLKRTKFEPVYYLSRWLYVAFKNFMWVFWVLTLIIGAPRVKYYQMRAGGSSGFDNLSYYETRSLFNMFRVGSEFVDSTSEHTEDVTGVGLIPLGSNGGSSSSDNDSSSKSSSKSSDTNGGGFAEFVATLIAIAAVFASLVFFLSLVILSFIHVNFWLVAIPCIGIGLFTLGVIDIKDGPGI